MASPRVVSMLCVFFPLGLSSRFLFQQKLEGPRIKDMQNGPAGVKGADRGPEAFAILSPFYQNMYESACIVYPVTHLLVVSAAGMSPLGGGFVSACRRPHFISGRWLGSSSSVACTKGS